MQELGGGKALDADVGFRGKLLSGGERQRLAKAAHQASFKGYLDVNEPKALLRGLLA